MSLFWPWMVFQCHAYEIAVFELPRYLWLANRWFWLHLKRENSYSTHFFSSKSLTSHSFVIQMLYTIQRTWIIIFKIYRLFGQNVFKNPPLSLTESKSRWSLEKVWILNYPHVMGSYTDKRDFLGEDIEPHVSLPMSVNEGSRNSTHIIVNNAFGRTGISRDDLRSNEWQ